jgi:Tfp pilus assembly protein PilV
MILLSSPPVTLPKISMRKTPGKNQHGFMMMEIIAGIVIIGLIVLVINKIPQAIKLIGRSRNQSLAEQITTKAIEDLRAKTYQNLANTSTPQSLADSRISSLPNGSGTYEVKDCPGISDPQPVCKSSPVEHTKYVTAKVTWTDEGKATTVEFDTLISEGGLQ